MPRNTSKNIRTSRKKKLSKELAIKPVLVSAHETKFEKLKKLKNHNKKSKRHLAKMLQRPDSSYPISSRKGVILTSTYSFTLRRIKKNDSDKLIHSMVKKGHSKKTLKSGFKRNPFHVSLQHLCAKGICYESPQKLSKWARLLHYAHLHNVKAEDLLGFLYQEGNYETINKKYNQIIANIDINSSRY